MDLERNGVEWRQLDLTQCMGKWHAVMDTAIVRWTQTVNVKLWNPVSHSYSFTCCRWAEALLFLAEFVCCLRSVKESSTLSQQVHLTVMAFQLYKIFIVLKCTGIRPIGMETNLEKIWRKISQCATSVPINYNTLCTSSTTTSEATCFDLNNRSSSGLLTIEFTNAVHVIKVVVLDVQSVL
jgi:hypothetical protein